MFAPCPHCGFLVALATTRHNPKQRCPRCDELLRAEPAAKPAKPKAASAKNEALAGAAAQSPEVAAPTPEPAPAAAPVPAATPPKREAAESGSKRKSTVARNEPATKPTTDVAPVSPAPASPDAVAVDAVTADATDSAEPAPTFEDSIAAASSIAPAMARPAPPRRRAMATRGTPSFARVRQPAPPRQLHWRGPVAIVVLVLLLTLQLLLAQRAELAAQARWRPLVAAVCGALGCELPPWREPIAFTMLDRNVQPKTGMAGVLTVSASFRNDARWPQPWPTIVLSLSDIDGRQVGQRAFAPAEYRDRGSAELLAPGQSAAVQLDVIEPAPRIVAFTFDFR
ncbi:phage FluMu protein Com [Lysobacter niastensis]|uniref:Phage FluMu protein Com n=1 Tax=Lysobacter niastensis TaxID=380629 RepID=A0ABU1W7D5_9GAMM|nr:DUF3426 domain-containing protein [Lysobacter niastensis]MDR7133488.1 phage FluMu protein Com [Lysobacter niastensis]